MLENTLSRIVDRMHSDQKEPVILLTGATGYVGGRLIAPLAAKGSRIRCLARRPEYLIGRVPAGVEVSAGDVLDPPSLTASLSGVSTAYYLVHALGTSGDFEQEDRCAARRFGAAARKAGVRKIIYLGGLGSAGSQLSSHLRSRQEVGEILRRTGVQVIEFRASVVIGSGSLSFEMIRALTERLPVMIASRGRRQRRLVLWRSVVAPPGIPGPAGGRSRLAAGTAGPGNAECGRTCRLLARGSL